MEKKETSFAKEKLTRNNRDKLFNTFEISSFFAVGTGISFGASSGATCTTAAAVCAWSASAPFNCAGRKNRENSALRMYVKQKKKKKKKKKNTSMSVTLNYCTARAHLAADPAL